jgi:rhamnose utilization protein RhaD (predicted bifunctional aldolase and dehydrogenase)
MKSLWSQSDADANIARYTRAGYPRDLAIRVYTTRLLGQVPALVLHGGGNTSVKTQWRDLDGAPVDVICVKGFPPSNWRR